jgi:Family of unknown function (DUF6960)
MDFEPGKWCLYPWFLGDGVSYIHPDDLDDFKALMPYGKLFRCVGSDRDFIILERAGKHYRVMPSLARPVPDPAFRFGDRVRCLSGGVEKRAVVREIIWHFNRNQPYFLLTIEGKKASRRYWSDELRADLPDT